jgi:hypothetical protein
MSTGQIDDLLERLKKRDDSSVVQLAGEIVQVHLKATERR